MKTHYVTFQVIPTDYLKGLGYKTKYYAVKCDNEKDTFECVSDLYGMEGLSYLRINNCGRLRHKNTKIIQYGKNYTVEID